jgi:hypothetical protein
MRPGGSAWFRPPYLAVPGVNARVVLFGALGVGAAATTLRVTRRHDLGPRAALLLLAVEVLAALLAAFAPSTRLVALVSVAWSAGDVLLFHFYPPDAAALVVAHGLELGLVLASIRRQLDSHESQDRLVLRASVVAMTVWIGIGFTPGQTVEKGRVLVALALFATGTLAAVRAEARRRFAERLRRGTCEDWTIAPHADSASTHALLPLEEAIQEPDVVLGARDAESPTYRSRAIAAPLALMTTRTPASPQRTHVLVVYAVMSLPLMVAASCVAEPYRPPNWWQAEALNSLGQIGKDVDLAYVMRGRLCASASQPVPADLRAIRGQKYQSTPDEWWADADRDAGFACLGYSMDQPQYYRYSYLASPDGTSFTALAEGDLNGDGVLSTFSLEGHIVDGGALDIKPMIHEVNPEE